MIRIRALAVGRASRGFVNYVPPGVHVRVTFSKLNDCSALFGSKKPRPVDVVPLADRLDTQVPNGDVVDAREVACTELQAVGGVSGPLSKHAGRRFARAATPLGPARRHRARLRARPDPESS